MGYIRNTSEVSPDVKEAMEAAEMPDRYWEQC
jgi:hypothetical protein